MNRIYYLLLLTAVLTGCKSKQPVVNSTLNIQKENSQDVIIELLENLYQSDNIILSPLSITTAMSMVYLGSSGNTETEMERVFLFDGNTNQFHQTQGANIRYMKSDNENAVVNIANGLWIEKDFEVKKTFVSNLQKYYNANLSEVRFGEPKEREQAKQEINQWISNKTNNRISNLIPQSAITPLTRLILVNAVYFKAGWKFAFNPKQNSKGKFTTPGGQLKDVTYMNQKRHLRMLNKSGFKCLELPYQNEQFSMFFILPDKSSNIQGVLSSVHFGMIDSLINQNPVYVELKVPKFKIDYKESLRQPLIEMGIAEAFSDNADFQNITARNNLKLTDVFHGAFIEIDEEGTEAAGATAAVIGIKSALLNKPVDFYLDRPFIFMVYDKKVKEILFAGICTDPA